MTSTLTDAALASSLRISVMRLARRLRLERDSDDLTLNQLAVLGTLDRSGPLSVGELAGIEKVKPPSMTRTVACLEEAGLVTRRPHDTDGRQVVVELTADGPRRARRRPAPPRRLAGPAPRRPRRPTSCELLHRVAPLLERIAARMRSTFAALRVRNYRLFATGSLVSNVGTWMQRVAQDWLVLTLDRQRRRARASRPACSSCRSCCSRRSPASSPTATRSAGCSP